MEQFEQRHDTNDAQPSRKTPKQLSAGVALDLLLDTAAIIDVSDTNCFANQAFAAMLGYWQKAIPELAVEDIFAVTPTNEYLLSAIRADAEQIVDLVRCEGRHAGQDQQGSLSRHVLPQRSDDTDTDGG
ncbi:MAG: hypothetical protein JOY55_15400 [Mycobacterium sp.]|nr:hypothetical protein [Mycobacterium sp.]MBV8293170.1 hypothetical protein [Mycobacterium sp.]